MLRVLLCSLECFNMLLCLSSYRTFFRAWQYLREERPDALVCVMALFPRADPREEKELPYPWPIIDEVSGPRRNKLKHWYLWRSTPSSGVMNFPPCVEYVLTLFAHLCYICCCSFVLLLLRVLRVLRMLEQRVGGFGCCFFWAAVR